MKLQPTMVRLSADVLQRIDDVMGGKHRRAKFIREAVEEKLAKSPKPSAKPNP